MISALKLVSVQRGHDPRDMILLVTGGAGPMHAAALGRELGVRKTIIPPFVGLFSAFGMLATSPRVDIARTRLAPVTESGLAAANALFDELEEEALSQLDAENGPPSVSRSAEMRYRGQEHTVAVEWPASLQAPSELLEKFGVAHERAYTFRLDDTAAEIVTCQVSATLPPPAMARIDSGGRSEVSPASRPLLTGGLIYDALVLDRASLSPELSYAGPALVEEPTATTLVLPGQHCRADAFGNLVIEETA